MSVRLILTSICCAALILGVSYFIDARLYWLAWAPFFTVAHEYAPSALSQLVSPAFAGRNKGLIFDEFPPTKFHDDLVSYIPRHIEVIVAVCRKVKALCGLLICAKCHPLRFQFTSITNAMQRILAGTVLVLGEIRPGQKHPAFIILGTAATEGKSKKCTQITSY